MRSRQIVDGLDLSGSGAGSAIDLSDEPLPFAANHTAVVAMQSADASSASVKLQGSDDGGDNWADLEDVDGNAVVLSAAGVQFFEVVLPEQIRTNITDDGTGSADVWLLNN